MVNTINITLLQMMVVIVSRLAYYATMPDRAAAVADIGGS